MNGNTIKVHRRRRAWTQTHLAEAAGLSVRTVQRIEQTGQCSDESLLAIAAAFDVDVASLTLPLPVPTTDSTPADTERWLFASIPAGQARIASIILLLPTFLFIASNILKYELGMPQLYDVLAALGSATGLDRFADFLTGPALLLGGPVLAVALSLLAQLRIAGYRTEEGIDVKTLRLNFDPYNMVLLLGAIAGLAILFAYAAMENLSEWVLRIVESG